MLLLLVVNSNCYCGHLRAGGKRAQTEPLAEKSFREQKKAEKAAQIAGFLLRVDVIKSRLCGAVVGCSRGLHDLDELSTRKVERGKFMELLNCSLLSRQPSPPPPSIQWAWSLTWQPSTMHSPRTFYRWVSGRRRASAPGGWCRLCPPARRAWRSIRIDDPRPSPRTSSPLWPSPSPRASSCAQRWIERRNTTGEAPWGSADASSRDSWWWDSWRGRAASLAADQRRVLTLTSWPPPTPSRLDREFDNFRQMVPSLSYSQSRSERKARGECKLVEFWFMSTTTKAPPSKKRVVKTRKLFKHWGC